MKKRIMFLAQSPGGVERYIQMLLKYLNKDLFEIIFVASYDFNEENYNGIVNKFININMCREINFTTDLKGVISIRKLIKEYKPDILYMHSSKAGALGRIANIGIKNKVIYNPHGWAFCMECSNVKKIIYRFIERILSKSTDVIIAISECEKNRAIANKICKSDKIKVILNGIDIQGYGKNYITNNIDREKLGIPKNAYVIGVVGRICENKAPEIFIKAAAIIKESIPEAFFILVGDGPDRAKIEYLIKKLSLEKCTIITGWTDEPFKYINCFDQGMLLTRWEGFGLVLTEYMIANVPVIATNIDSIPELIKNEVNGLLVKVNDIEGTAKASIRIYEDNKLRSFIVKNGNRVVREKFDVKRKVNQHESLFINNNGGVKSAEDFSNNGCIQL